MAPRGGLVLQLLGLGENRLCKEEATMSQGRPNILIAYGLDDKLLAQMKRDSA